ncbi:hypothetical protein N0V82_009235 [Gnomoniopsis sp. IMI 355080]|nr:hypothetical protein N0V82_009235 [Gnomoniopsis sp. IMI 355080]
MLTTQADRLAAGLSVTDYKVIEPLFLELERTLTLRTYLGGLYSLSPSDQNIWTALRVNKVAYSLVRKGTFTNVSRWFNYLEAAHPEFQDAAKAQDEGRRVQRAAASKAGGNYNIGLKDTAKGVVTRFPPEPSGYLHIGHAKAAFLNDYFAHTAYPGGTLIVRFDDTNPAKEKQEFEDSIIHDLALLGIQPDKVSYTSDYFEQLYQICERMIAEGNAYADDTPQEEQAGDRRNRRPSKRRDRPAEESLAMFKEMRKGTPLGRKHCIRARAIYDSSVGTLRDPILYRFPNFAGKEPHPHHRTGWEWNIYPTYDFACPVVDSLEGVTHALRTTEYTDRNGQYHWLLETLSLRPVHLWDFARINFIRTFLSKRKLAKVVDSGRVTGWDDPRMPTVRGILRRGLTVAALREFMLKQGPSRNTVTMDWGILWSMNNKVIEPASPRHTAINTKNMVVTSITNGPSEAYTESRPKHPKNPSIGVKKVVFGKTILIEQVDAASFVMDEEITIMSWGNAIVRKITMADDHQTVSSLELELHLDGDVRKTDKKVTWLAKDIPNDAKPLVDVELWDFNYLLTKDSLDKDDKLEEFLRPVTSTMTEAMCDFNVALLRADDIVQLERKGFYRVDKALEQGPGGKAILFKIPTSAKD